MLDSGAQEDKMIFFESKYRVCKYCGEKVEISLGHNTDRMLGHLRKRHPEELNSLSNLYLQDIVNISFNKD